MGFKNFFNRIFNVEAGRDSSGNYYYYIDENAFGNSVKYLEWSLNNPVLQTVIALRCKLYSQMKITAENEKGEQVEIDELKLLENPNYFQSQQDWLFQQMWFLSATGNNLIYQIKAFERSLPKAIYNLNPEGIDYKKTKKKSDFIVSEKEIKDFESMNIEYRSEDNEFKIPLSRIIPLYDLSNGIVKCGLIQSPSRVSGINTVLQNIDENLRSKNINLKFSQKYLSKNTANSDGNPQLQAEDRDIIEKRIGSKNLIVTNASIEVQHLVKDLKNLSLDPMFEADAIKVLLAFDMNRDTLNYSNTGSKFDNNEQGIVNVIQNSIQSSADNLMTSLNNSWGLVERGLRLKASFNHLPVMQTLLKTKIETYKTFQETLTDGLSNGTITPEEAKQMSDKMKINLGL